MNLSMSNVNVVIIRNRGPDLYRKHVPICYVSVGYGVDFRPFVCIRVYT